MNRAAFEKTESTEDFTGRLREHGLFRDDDVTFDDFGDAMYVYEGDDFSVDAELFAELEISSLLVKGDVRGEYLAVQDILPDYGVFCVTGSVRLRDMSYATESTGVVIGGDLEVSNVFYARSTAT